MTLADLATGQIGVRVGSNVGIGISVTGYSERDYERAAREWIDNLPGGARLAFELIADPLNLLPGVGTLGRVGAGTALTLERAGFLLATAALPGRSIRIFDDALRGIGLTLRAPARAGRKVGETPGVMAAALRAGEHPLVRVSQADHLFHVVERATRLKTEAVANARAGLEWLMANGFREIPKPKVSAGTGTPKPTAKLVDPPQFHQRIRPETKTMLTTGNPKTLLEESPIPAVRRFLRRGDAAGDTTKGV